MSTRYRKLTEKGKYYNEHLTEFNDTCIGKKRSSVKTQEEPQDLVSPVSSSNIQGDLSVSTGNDLGPNDQEEPQDLVSPVSSSNMQGDLSVSTGNDLGPNDLSTPLVTGAAEKYFITPRIARERSKSEPGRPLNLRLEIEEATSPSQLSPLVTNVPHVLPKSVMVVDSRFVGEIHFEPVETDDTAPVHDESLAFLSEIYELYHEYGYGVVSDFEEIVEVGVEVGVGV